MTCFKTPDGKTVRSQCSSPAEYQRFIKAIEKGATFEEAFKGRSIASVKGHRPTPFLLRIKEVLEEYNEKSYFILRSYHKRHKCSPDEALRWAAQTGRVVVKKNKRKEFLKRKEK